MNVTAALPHAEMSAGAQPRNLATVNAMSLSNAQLERYARHIILKEIGGAGQLRLLDAHVGVVGAGGIGAPVIQYLAAAGIGRITVFDDDIVSLSNLQRQVIFGTDDVGRSKVAVAQDAVAQINPDVELIALDQRLDEKNAAQLLRNMDVVIDGCDSFATRLLVSDGCQSARIPLVSAAVGSFEGQLAVYRGWEADKPCYRCFVGDDPDRPDVSCADQGVVGALTGIVGSIAALETLRALVPFGDDPAGKLLMIDALNFRFRTLNVPKDGGCRCRPV